MNSAIGERSGVAYLTKKVLPFGNEGQHFLDKLASLVSSVYSVGVISSTLGSMEAVFGRI